MLVCWISTTIYVPLPVYKSFFIAYILPVDSARRLWFLLVLRWCCVSCSYSETEKCSRLLNSDITVLRVFLWLQMEGQLLNSLMPRDFSEHICVRVSRFWDFYDPQNEAKLLHSNLVLIDEEVCEILYMYQSEVFSFCSVC